jgi:hypothetical protein
MAMAAGHSDDTRSIILSHLINWHAEGLEVIDVDESQRQRVRYANRAITSAVLAVSWLSTITESTAFFDMESFAEPLRCGLRNHWFPDALVSTDNFAVSTSMSREVSYVFEE